ncbi:MAG: hypothetical protein AAFN09_00300 [Pseudomonadota bacterium]
MEFETQMADEPLQETLLPDNQAALFDEMLRDEETFKQELLGLYQQTGAPINLAYQTPQPLEPNRPRT